MLIETFNTAQKLREDITTIQEVLNTLPEETTSVSTDDIRTISMLINNLESRLNDEITKTEVIGSVNANYFNALRAALAGRLTAMETQFANLQDPEALRVLK